MVKGMFKNSMVLSLSAEPKRREYMLKSLKAVKTNQIRRRMNNENQVSGVVVIGYEIEDYQQKHAIIRLMGGEELEASFVEFPIADKRKAISCFNATRQVSHESIVAPLFLTYNKKKKRMLLFYKRFSTLLADWGEGDASWWQQNTLEQLRVTQYIHNKGFIHTGLNDPKNFAIQDNKLKMLNVTSSLHEYLQTHPGSNEETIKKANFRNLGDLMRLKNQEIKVLSGVDRAFFNLFNRADLGYKDWVHKLITHPYGMNSREYMLCFHRIHLADERNYLVEILDDVTKGQQFNQYRNWIQIIESKNARHLKEALQKKKKKYREGSVKSLIVFLRNIAEHKHHGEEADNENIAQYYDELTTEIEKLFPGLLTLLLEQVRVESNHYWLFSFESV